MIKTITVVVSFRIIIIAKILKSFLFSVLIWNVCIKWFVCSFFNSNSLSCSIRNILGLDFLLHFMPTVLLACIIYLNLSGSSWLHWQLEHVTNSQTLSYVGLPGIWTWKSGFSHPGWKQLVVHMVVFNGFCGYCFHSIYQLIFQIVLWRRF